MLLMECWHRDLYGSIKDYGYLWFLLFVARNLYSKVLGAKAVRRVLRWTYFIRQTPFYDILSFYYHDFGVNVSIEYYYGHVYDFIKITLDHHIGECTLFFVFSPVSSGQEERVPVFVEVEPSAC